MYTMNPLRSRSNAIDRVIGSDDDPAITTTSTLLPLLARFALLFLRLVFFLITRYVMPPVARTMIVVKILCRIAQSYICVYVEAEAFDITTDRRGDGGTRGRAASGIHSDDESASRRTLETFSRCLST